MNMPYSVVRLLTYMASMAMIFAATMAFAAGEASSVTAGPQPPQLPPVSAAGPQPPQLPPVSAAGPKPPQLPPVSAAEPKPPQLPPVSAAEPKPPSLPPVFFHPEAEEHHGKQVQNKNEPNIGDYIHWDPAPYSGGSDPAPIPHGKPRQK